MSLTLDGSSQYLSSDPGDGIGAGTQPMSIFALVYGVGLRTSGLWNGIVSCGDQGASGCQFEITAEASPRLYFSLTDGLGLQESYSSFTITPSHGWLLVGVCWTGANRYFYCYDFSTLTLTTGTAGGGSGSSSSFTNPGLEPALIGAIYATTVTDYYPDSIGWVAVWRRDISDGGGATPTQIMQLTVQGPWGMLETWGNTKICTFYSLANKNTSTVYNKVPANPGVLTSMTISGSPALWDCGPGELPPFGPIPVMRVPATPNPPSGAGGGSGGLHKLYPALRRRLV